MIHFRVLRLIPSRTLLLDIDARLSEIRGNLDEVSHSVRNELPPIRAAIENLMVRVSSAPSAKN